MHEPLQRHLTPGVAPSVVLDTNVVLDWLLFHDAAVVTLAAAIVEGRVRWVATRRMRDELASVLQRRALARWSSDVASILVDFDRWAVVLAEPPATPPVLRCNDPDDQVFIDLACSQCARWLVSHDRQVLRLAKRLHDHGVAVSPPATWVFADPSGASGCAAK